MKPCLIDYSAGEYTSGIFSEPGGKLTGNNMRYQLVQELFWYTSSWINT